ncbi:hypothetical protein HPB48_021622 [Haemaphysalis longicornis]|uniref:Uncharacterized protein n=1 Tax=Haemaphysalis longicornis TaxID=44386 RepID=A0A9J6GS74_HAELO|nr:hypothetical protein HPB48_021622 [Haemaphysalis longicornis]
MCTSQKDAENVQSFAARLRTLGNTAMGGRLEPESKREIRKELLDKQLRTQFLNGLRDPIKRSTLSRDPKTLDEADDTAVRGPRNERAVNGAHAPVRSVREGDRETDELRARLERGKGLLDASIELQNKQMRDLDSPKANASQPVTTAGSAATFRGSEENRRADGGTQAGGNPNTSASETNQGIYQSPLP